MKRFVACLLLTVSVITPVTAKEKRAQVWAQDNLVAWCIVPFDAKKRGPSERAEMVAQLGIKKVAYDWRGEHVATFEEEILQYKKHGIEFFAFWSWHDAIGPLIKKHGIQPQVWRTLSSPKKGTQQEKIAAAAKAMLPLAEKTKALGLKLGLYNHGGWGGEPANMVAVCQALRKQGHEQVGIVYNFHHGHGQVGNFSANLAAMKPYLHCLNLNGMSGKEQKFQKILPLGRGQNEQAMMQAIQDSGYHGPIGILGHVANRDVEVVLKENLEGFRTITGFLKKQ
jgi:sugar phosphate isomerase/epimerase